VVVVEVDEVDVVVEEDEAVEEVVVELVEVVVGSGDVTWISTSSTAAEAPSDKPDVIKRIVTTSPTGRATVNWPLAPGTGVSVCGLSLPTEAWTRN
jgi:hypothetical protein